MMFNSPRKVLRLLAMLFALSLFAAACGSDDAEETTTGESSETDEADTGADEADDAAEDTEEAGLPDLDGRTVTVGVENAYLPFNYIPVGGDAGEGLD